MKRKKDVLGDLIWVRYPMHEHAARPIPNRPAHAGMLWVRWEVNGQDEQVPLDCVRVLPGCRRRSTAPTEVRRKRKPQKLQQTQRRKQPQKWPQTSFEEAVVQFRDIAVGDFVYRDKELFRVSGISCFYKKHIPDLLRLEHVDTHQVVYEYKESVEPGLPF